MTTLASRVVFGATCYAEVEVALSLAARLAAAVDGELRGLLIEEETIMALARRPGVQLFTQSGQRVTNVDLSRMVEALRYDAERFSRELAVMASSLALNWSFNRLTGEMANVLAEALEPGDLIVLAGHVPSLNPSRFVYLAGPLYDPALEEVAIRLASGFGLPLSILRPASVVSSDSLRSFEEILVAGVEDISDALAHIRSDTILIANLANAPKGLTSVTGARFTRILKQANNSVDMSRL